MASQQGTYSPFVSLLEDNRPLEMHGGFSDDPTGQEPDDALWNRHIKRKRGLGLQKRCCNRTYCRLNSIASVAAAVNLGWAVGETMLIPFLLRLGISSSTASLVWAINPVFGIVLQGLVGVFTDHTGRLKTLALLFSVTSCIGLLLVAYMPNLLDLFYGSNVAPMVCLCLPT